ncbi:MAG: M67 family metallopeptidase [Thermoleophilia bacterium]
MTSVLRLTRTQQAALVAHARSCRPEEACGILAGTRDGGTAIVTRVFLMENAEHSNIFYQMESREQFQVFDEIEKEGLQLVGIFHSHPHSPAFPSGVDLELAFYPDAAYLIVSLMNDEPESHAFRIVDGQIRKMDIVIETG